MNRVLETKKAQTMLLDREIQMVTRNKIKEFSLAFEKMEEELRRTPKKRNYINKEEFECILSKTAVEVCDQCENYENCYGGEFSLIYKEAYKIVDRLESDNFLTLDSVPASFIQRCDRLNSMLRELKKNYELIRQNLVWTNRMIDTRVILARQMAESAEILQNFCKTLQQTEEEKEYIEKNVSKICKRYKIIVKKVVVYEAKKRQKEIYMAARALQGRVTTEKIAKLMSKVLGRRMIPAKETRRLLGMNYAVLHFVEDTRFSTVKGVSSRKKENTLVSGDNFAILVPEVGREVFIAADGMGSGVRADEMSQRVLMILEELLVAGFREEEAVRCANTMGSIGTSSDIYTTIDMLSLDTYEGRAKFIKTGGAQTFFVRDGVIETILPSTLPAGILEGSEIDCFEKNLCHGDLFILVTDGVLENLDLEKGEERFIEWIQKMDLTNPQQMADYLMGQLYHACNGKLRDDAMIMTVLVYLKETK